MELEGTKFVLRSLLSGVGRTCLAVLTSKLVQGEVHSH